MKKKLSVSILIAVLFMAMIVVQSFATQTTVKLTVPGMT